MSDTHYTPFGLTEAELAKAKTIATNAVTGLVTVSEAHEQIVTLLVQHVERVQEDVARLCDQIEAESLERYNAYDFDVACLAPIRTLLGIPEPQPESIQPEQAPKGLPIL